MTLKWKNLTMLEACDLITCGVAARPNYVDKGVPFLSAKNVKEGQIIYEGYNCITEEKHKELTKKNKPLPGDILYTRVGSFGEAAVIEESIEFSVFVSLTLIKPKKDLLDSYFLKYYLNSHEVKTLAKKSITSSGVGNLNVGTVRKFPIPIPPLQEQQRIVEILDKAFEAIDQAKANVERNIQNAEELFQSKLYEVFSQRGDGWEEKKLSDVVNISSGGTPSKKNNEYWHGTIPWVSPKDMKSLEIDSSQDSITKFALEEGKAKLLPTGTVLLVVRSGILARTIPVGISRRELSINQDIKALKPSQLIDSFYLLNYFRAFENEILELVSRGATVHRLETHRLKNLSIRFPDIAEQKKINAKVRILEQKKQSYISKLIAKTKNIEELKKSILQKAFSGELTASEELAV